ncbi:MAG: hypothetical protein KC619_04020 [Myxococcales bacterium]|nr:hypothetical protein [Myxococcales bacterium]
MCTPRFKKTGWLTCVWRSPEGVGYITDADGFLYRHTPGGGFPHEKVAGVLTGVWGIDDAHVYAWGQLDRARPVLYRYDGGAWAAMPTPDAPIVGMHGLRPDELFAVGSEGFIARWDGSAWTTMTAPDRSNLASVRVVSSDEVYAAGHGGSLHQGSVHGWSPVLRDGDPISALAHWGGELWVATLGDLGLCKLVDRALESFKPNLLVTHLDDRGALVYTTTAKIGETTDGLKFTSFNVSAFEGAASSDPPAFR